MQFLDKAFNHVVKWESIDTSIPKMLNLIQSEILEKASSSDLHELEKGMRKTWVLGVGGGANRRYYPASNRPVRLCFQFNIFTHRLQRISLQDTKNKTEYFIPSGKAACTKLQHAVLRRIAQLSNDVTSVQRKSVSGGKFLNRKKRPAIPTLAIFGLVALIAAVGVFTVFSCSGKTTSEAITTVQNGYLGEYTDITVKEILDSYYGMLYENEEWDAGTTNSGSVIVQAKYFDEGMENDATTIQFTMLNEECFKITAFVDPLNPVEKATDMLAAMNYNYVLAYVEEHRSMAGNPLAEHDFVARLERISGSAVKYGASANYSGNRAAICEIDGSAPLDVSVAMLLDNYGLLDMSYYSTDIDFPAIENTEDNVSTSNETSVVTSGFEGIDEKNVIISDNFWNNHSACSDPMSGEFFNYEHDMRFWVYAGEKPNGDISYLLEYTLGGETVEADGGVWESIITVIIPSSEVIIANKSSSIVFDIGAYHPQYSGTFIFDMYYTGDGTEYTVCADIPGIIDTNGNSVSIEVISLFDWY